MDWKPIRAEDLPAVETIAAEVWPPELYESPDAFAARAAIGGSYCYVLWDEGRIVGYCIAHPWGTTIPRLGAVLKKPKEPRTLFLHDLALLPGWRGRGIGEAIVEYLKGKAADAFGSVTLVAVNGSGSFWRSRGFTPLARATKAESYGAGAEPMSWVA